MRLAHCVAKRIGAGICQRGDVKGFRAIAAAGELAETFRAGEGQIGLGLGKVGGTEDGND